MYNTTLTELQQPVQHPVPGGLAQTAMLPGLLWCAAGCSRVAWMGTKLFPAVRVSGACPGTLTWQVQEGAVEWVLLPSVTTLA
jgi:hypothetical protein